MTNHLQTDGVLVFSGDCRNLFKLSGDNTIDAVVTDPPYGLEFMGKEWDSFGRDTGNGYQEKPRMNTGKGLGGYKERPNYYTAGHPYQRWCTEWAAECLRVLKPGGYLLAFGGTRTAHRLACAIEDAGFEIRDSITWLYGSGFPKSLDVSKAIDKAAGAEREVVGTKASNRPNVIGAVPGGSMGGGVYTERLETAPATDAAQQWAGWGTALKPASEPIIVARKPFKGTVAANVLEHGTGALNIDGCRVGTHTQTNASKPRAERTGFVKGFVTGSESLTHDHGRWPANVVLSHTPSCEIDVGCVLGCPVADLDEQSGVLKTGGGDRRSPKDAGIYGAYAAGEESREFAANEGGASRFFPVFRYQAKAPTKERPKVEGVAHPTVKPLALMRWLVRLVTPPGGLVLDPFAGSGTTLAAARDEGMRALGYEAEPDYLRLIAARLGLPDPIDTDEDVPA